jgi:hypothetical protein
MAETDPSARVTLTWQNSDGQPLGDGARVTLVAGQLAILQVRVEGGADITQTILVVRAIAGPAAQLATGRPRPPPALRPVEHVGAW